MKRTIVAAICLLSLIAGNVFATPIQWKTIDGGNGHWYEAVVGSYTWFEALVAADERSYDSLNGHLATFDSSAESDWVYANMSSQFAPNLWIGGYRDISDPNSSAPTGGWKWITGENWDYTNWHPGNPHGLDYLYITSIGKWGDWYFTTAYGGSIPGYLVEYESNTLPPSVIIASPITKGFTTTDPVIQVSGYVCGSSTIISVSWSNDRGGSGSCIGTTSWSVSGIALQAGSNVITITAIDSAGRTSFATSTVVMKPIQVFITSPTTDTTYDTSSSVLNIAGNVADSSTVTTISWSNDRGGSGTCSGTGSWSANGISLQTGSNVITVTAVDAGGNTDTDTLTVVFTPVVPPNGTPIQWKTSDGGNDHWYEAVAGAYTWFEAFVMAEERSFDGCRGHLVTFESSSESSWVHTNIRLPSQFIQNLWIGGYRDRKDPSSGEPTGGWKWITGETWSYTNWHDGNPHSQDYSYVNVFGTWGDWSYSAGSIPGCLVEYESSNLSPNVIIASPATGPYTAIDSVLDVSGYVCGGATITSVDWSNDRGGSGKCVGTIAWSTSGINLQPGRNLITITAVDAAGNASFANLIVNLPEPIQWPLSEGGNGHWYEAVVGTNTWFQAVFKAQERSFKGFSGHLATLDSAAENDWVHANVNLPAQLVQNMWLGGYRDGNKPGSGLPNGGWQWITGETWGYTNWYSGCPGMRDYLYICSFGTWGDWNYTSEFTGSIPGYLVEYEPAALPLKVIIASPAASPYATTQPVFDISGYVSHSVDVLSVSWSNASGGSGNCVGTASWSASGISLRPGSNKITVTAVDADGNTASATVTAVVLGPVQWTIAEGGNGHWYEAVPGVNTWYEALVLAQERSFRGLSGHLATITSAAENQWLHANISLPPEIVQNELMQKMWLGGYQERSDPGYREPARAWKWITGELLGSWGYANWYPGYPDDQAGPACDYLYMSAFGSWGDWRLTDASNIGHILGYLVEYEPSCVPPRVFISSPTTDQSYVTSDSFINVSGYVSDSVAVKSVSWSSATGESGQCVGTSSWSANGIKLQAGSNIITVTAVDGAGHTASDTITVTIGATARSINFSTSGCEITGIRDSSIGVLNDGSFPKLIYHPFSCLLDVPEDKKFHYEYILPYTLSRLDMGWTGRSALFPTERTLTVDGESWSTGGYPLHAISLDIYDGGLISATAGWSVHTANLGDGKVMDVVIPTAAMAGVGLSINKESDGITTYSTSPGGGYPIAFRIRDRVGAPFLISPADDAPDLDLCDAPILLRWSEVPGAATYGVEIASDPDFQHMVCGNQGFSQTCWTPPNTYIAKKIAVGVGCSSFGFFSATSPRYYWRVRPTSILVNGVASTGYGEWSEVRSFTSTTAYPTDGTPVLRYPANGKKDLPYLDAIHLSWTDVKGAINYRIEIGRGWSNGWFKELLASVNTISNGTYATFYNDNLRPGEDYYWRVRVDEYRPEEYVGDCSWSEERSFRMRDSVQALQSLGSALPLRDKTWVSFSNKVITASGNDWFYAQEQGKPSGIKVVWPGPPLAPERDVTVSGQLESEGPEKFIRADSVTIGEILHTRPFAMALHSLGGHYGIGSDTFGFTDVFGMSSLYNIGALVKVWGTVTYVDSSGTFVYVDDGSKLNDGNALGGDGSPVPGVRVMIPKDTPLLPQGGCLAVTGVSSSASIDGRWIRVIRPRKLADITWIGPR